MNTKRRRLSIAPKRRTEPGSAPGQIVPNPAAGRPKIDVIAFGPSGVEEIAGADLDTIRGLRGTFPVVWVDVVEFGDPELLRRVGGAFDVHALALEDVVNTHQRPKVEDYDDCIFVVARMLRGETQVETEQVAFCLGEGFLLSFQERPGDCFEPVRERLRRSSGRIRSNGADYLLYALLDAIIDAYFPMLEAYGERLEALEDAVIQRPGRGAIAEVHHLKRDLLLLRRAVWPHREMVSGLLREEHGFIGRETRPYLRDAYDHTVQLMDIVETYREIASQLVDVYVSSTSARLNEIMKVLTIIATIFMPLGFLASLWGMNFDRQASPWNMPELGWAYGYPFAIAVMAAVFGGMVWYFRRKGWI